MEKRGAKRLSVLFYMSVIALTVIILSWSFGKTGLRWAKNKYFDRLGTHGQLRTIRSGRWEQWSAGFWVRNVVMKRSRHWGRLAVRLARIDPRYHDIRLWRGKPKTINWIMRKTKAIVAINAGLFDPRYRPLGLLKKDGIVINRHLHKRKVDGVFFVKNDQIGVARGRGFKHKGVRTAFQSAPFLVEKGKRRAINQKPWRVDRRSALCIDRDGRLLLFATDGLINGLSYYELGLLMSKRAKEGGLGCWQGLNLDGGSSTQWAVRGKKKHLVIRGVEAVPLYLLVFPKKNSEAD